MAWNFSEAIQRNEWKESIERKLFFCISEKDFDVKYEIMNIVNCKICCDAVPRHSPIQLIVRAI